MYKNGLDFVNDLYQKYGLLEASRIGNEYLMMQKNVTDKIEIHFCKEVRIALAKLDNM